MTSYEFPTPRAVSGVIAVALTALTIGLFAVLPAETGPSERMQEIATAASPASQRGRSPRPRSPATSSRSKSSACARRRSSRRRTATRPPSAASRADAYLISGNATAMS